MWGTVPKALQQSRRMTSVALPLSAGAVPPSQRAGQVGLALGEAMLAVSSHLPVLHGPQQSF